MERLKFLIFFILLLIQMVGGQAFRTVTSEPNLVQSVNAKLILSFSLTKRVAAGGYVRIEFPEDQMTVSPQVTNCQEDLGMITITSCSANTEKNYIEFIIQ